MPVSSKCVVEAPLVAYFKLMQARANSLERRWPLFLVAAAVAALLAMTIALWAYYGTAVFYETILAGIAACF